MYITSDAEDALDGESILRSNSLKGITLARLGLKGKGPLSVHSVDVQKVKDIYTNTPNGKMQLKAYLTGVESEIAAEEAARKRDVAAVRAKMDRNFAFNAAARRKMKKALLVKMAANAKKAKDDLNHAMRWVQWRFHKAAKLANARNNANIKRSLALRQVIAKDKAEAARSLRYQVIAQQRAQAAYASAINKRIRSTDKSVAVNAAQIKSDAIAAQKALAKAVDKFNTKAANAKELAAKGRSRLAAQLARQDKATRQWANNRLKVVIAKTAAHFRRVRDQMAADRRAADFALKAATTRMTASLNAFKALNKKNFTKNMRNIAAAKREAAMRVRKARREFKVKIRVLRATVHQQVSKTNTRISQLSGVVDKHKLAQAKVNANVRAEMDRMIKIGNQRYNAHLAKDKMLKKLILTNKAANARRLKAMARHYAAELDKIRKTMKKNRAHATRMLAKKTAGLYAAIAKSEKAQMKVNGDLAKLTRNARLEISDSLRTAKTDFSRRMASLHGVVVRNDRKFEKKMDRLTGIVRKNAVKSAKGRSELRDIMKANRKELHAAVAAAVHKGQQRMMQVENRLKGMNKATKASLTMKITSRISAYAKAAAAQIEGLRIESKKARAAMRKELLYAVSSASKEAKANLQKAYKSAGMMFNKANERENKAAKKSAVGRAKLAKSIAASQRQAQRQLTDAVATMARSLSALKLETRKKIKKTNKKITAYADQMAKTQKEVQAQMKSMMTTMKSRIKNMRARTAMKTRMANMKSVAGFNKVSKKIMAAMAKANKRSDRRFAKLFLAMTKQRRAQNKKLNAGVIQINQSIAKQAALQDSRFSKTVKDIKAARLQATKQVRDARKSFATALVTQTAAVKQQEVRLMGEVRLVGEELSSWKVQQARINRRTGAEMSRITNLANKQNSASIRARGKLRRLLDENKKAAHEEVVALNTLFTRKLAAVRRQATRNAREAGRDLSRASKKMYAKLASVQLRAFLQNKSNRKAIASYAKQSQAAIKASSKAFGARLTTMTNLVVANNAKAMRGLEVLTGVIRNYKVAGKKDRALIRAQNKALGDDLRGKITNYVQQGEARAKRIAHRARAHLKAARKSMLLELSARVEATANKIFKSVQQGHKTTADNYLSLKAYAVSARSSLSRYISAGKGKNLASLGELLMDVARLSKVKVKAAAGVGIGGSKITSVFSSKKFKVASAFSKINGLVNEYSMVVNQVRARWPLGLGKYLLMKFEESMSKKGVLQVDKVSGKAGNFVFVNGRTVGLSNKLSDFESLAVKMTHYEGALAKLTAGLAEIAKKHAKISVKPPQWQGK
jgi:hypothetical protein